MVIDDTMIAFGNFHSYHNYFHRYAIFEIITLSLLEIGFRQLTIVKQINCAGLPSE